MIFFQSKCLTLFACISACNCNPAGAMEVPGYPLGGCGQVPVGQLCECKENVRGHICDECKPGYYGLDRNNPRGCRRKFCRIYFTLYILGNKRRLGSFGWDRTS